MNVKVFRSWAIAIAIPLGLGTLVGFITGAGRYETMYHPPLSPPAWLFPVAWSLLYVLMGTASWLVWRSNSKYRDGALKIYAMQLMVNLIWPFLFFSWGAYLMAFLWILLLGYLIYWTWKDFNQIDTRAGSLIFIYFLWVIYAGYLNLVIAIHSLI